MTLTQTTATPTFWWSLRRAWNPGSTQFFGAKADLEALLDRGVDLVEPGAVRNPYVLDSINRHREAVYAA